MKVENGRGSYAIMAEINMIPFIDIALVLLIIFMVMTPALVRQQLKVDLPKADSSLKITAPEEDRIQVEVRHDGSILIGDQPVAASRIEATLKRIAHDPSSKEILIHADKSVQFQYVVDVLSAAHGIGITRVGVSVIDKTDTKKKRNK